jgi:hypothetical protein
VIKNKKIKDHKNPDDSSNKALILAFFLFTRVKNYTRGFKRNRMRQA